MFPGARGAGFRHLRLGRREKGLTVKERPTREPLARNRLQANSNDNPPFVAPGWKGVDGNAVNTGRLFRLGAGREGVSEGAGASEGTSMRV